MQGKINNWMKALALSAATFVGASSAFAGFTSIGNHPLAEATQEGILEHQYGGDWHKVGDDFYNGSMSAKRMDDFLSNPSALEIGKGECGMSTDQTWCGEKFKATAVAKFSGNSQVLGIVDSSGHSTTLMNVKGYGYDIDPATAVADVSGKTFEWQRKGDGTMQSSVDSENADGRNHMITYVIEGLPGMSGPVWMLFFEDMNRFANTPKKRTWADYNDLAVEVRSIAKSVPLPPAGWAGLLTLGSFAVVRSRKLISRALMA